MSALTAPTRRPRHALDEYAGVTHQTFVQNLARQGRLNASRLSHQTLERLAQVLWVIALARGSRLCQVIPGNQQRHYGLACRSPRKPKWLAYNSAGPAAATAAQIARGARRALQ